MAHPDPYDALGRMTIAIDRLNAILENISAAAVGEPHLRSPSMGSHKTSRYPWRERPEERYPSTEQHATPEYDTKYVPDVFGNEALDNARVWKAYKDRATELDDDEVDSWNKTLDTLLIFAALFSAVSTAFLVESYKLLQPDYAEYLVNITLASVKNTPIADPADFQASTAAYLVNWFWFHSLGFAVSVAFVAILVKQWLQEYISRMRRPTSSLRHWAWRHRFFRSGLNTWKMKGIITALPFFLHASQVLFSGGLITFLWTIDQGIAISFAVPAALMVTAYVAVFVAPARYGNCPTATPLLGQVCDLYLSISKTKWRPAFLVKTSTWNAKVRDSEALYWMITELPAENDVVLALDAAGALDVCAHSTISNFLWDPDYALLRGDTIKLRAWRRFEQLAGVGLSVDAGAVSRCLRTMSFLGVKARSQYVDVKATLARWSSIATHDAYFMAATQAEFSKTIVDFILQGGDSLPCSPQALVLRGHDVVTGNRRNQDLPELFSLFAVSCFGLSSHNAQMSMDCYSAAQHILNELESRVPYENPLELESPEASSRRASIRGADVRVRGLCILLARGMDRLISKHREENAVPLLDLVVDLTIRQLDAVLGRVDISLLGDMHTMEALTTRRRLQSTLSPGSVRTLTSLLTKRLVGGHLMWSDRLRVVVRNIFHRLTTDNEGTVESMELLLQQSVPRTLRRRFYTRSLRPAHETCGQVASYLQSFDSSTHARSQSFVNALQSGEYADAGQPSIHVPSAWQCYAQGAQGRDKHATFVEIEVIALCLLHRSGQAVGPLLTELLGTDEGLGIILSRHDVRFTLAIHAKEISPSWWERMQNTLRTCESAPSSPGTLSVRFRRGPSSTGGRRRAQLESFIREVDAAGCCTHCPARPVFKMASAEHVAIPADSLPPHPYPTSPNAATTSNRRHFVASGHTPIPSAVPTITPRSRSLPTSPMNGVHDVASTLQLTLHEQLATNAVHSQDFAGH